MVKKLKTNAENLVPQMLNQNLTLEGVRGGGEGDQSDPPRLYWL